MPWLEKLPEKSINIIGNMECEEEELSTAQLAAYSRPDRDSQAMWTSLQNKLKLQGFTDIPEPIVLFQFPKLIPGVGYAIQTTPGKSQTIIRQSTGSTPVVNQALSPRNASQGSYQPKMAPQGNRIASGPNISTGSVLANTTIVPIASKTTTIQPIMRNRGRGRGRPRGRGRGSYTNLPSITSTSLAANKVSPATNRTSDEISKSSPAESKDAGTNNKPIDKTYPSLVVIARPTLIIKKMTPQEMKNACQERSVVDGKVKQVLLYTPTKFTEWLIQQGLLRSEQFCSTHVDADMKPIKLKLGMYSDATKFPYSGGYVWISDCCPQRFISVFSGSIFEGAPYPPNILLKLMYHWACQTSMVNIVSWVKVNTLFIKSFFTCLRSVCTAAVHEKYEKLGGNGKKVEVGVISLGTTTSDGHNRQVKIEVLGIMESDSKSIRLRAVEPSSDPDKNSKKRFQMILEPMEHWVHKDSAILTDYTVDKNTLHLMGFTDVTQVATHDSNNKQHKYSNINVMDYLRKVVPRMFQNTLSLLSRQIIQQFLDELVWRERWGYVSAKAFDCLVEHIAEQTKLSTGDFLLPRLQRVALNPFKNWKYADWKVNCSTDETMDLSDLESSSSKLTQINEATSSSPRLVRKRSAAPDPQPVVPVKSSPVVLADFAKDSDLMALDSFYYGMIPADRVVRTDKKPLNMKCVLCPFISSDIIQMMKHLIGHSFHEAEGKDAAKSPMCRYCLRSFASDYWLQSHLQETHLKTGPALMCCICEEKFKDRTTLILHMHRNHVELELPYLCKICNFRTSQHTAVIDHFYEVHSKGNIIMCPFCLKTVALVEKGNQITRNQYFYLNHIQKHKRKVIARKCNRCVLWFVQKGILVEHQNNDHSSCNNVPNIERFPGSVTDSVMMPKPKPFNNEPEPVQKDVIQKLTRDPILNGNLFSRPTEFKEFKLNGIPEEGAPCSECESDLREEDHFPGVFHCKKCKFVTNCYNMIIDHVTVYHDIRFSKDTATGKQMGGKPYINSYDLGKPMHCVCGFESSSGNKLALHLMSCKKKSAYPSRAIAHQNSIVLAKPLENDDEDYDPDDPDEIIEDDDPPVSGVGAANFDLRSVRRGRSGVDDYKKANMDS